MLTFFKENQLPKEIHYCIQNIEQLPKINMKSLYEKDRFNNPAPKQYKDAEFNVLIHRQDKSVEIKEFQNDLFILNADDEYVLSSLLQLVIEKLHSLQHTNLDLEPLLKYRANIDTIYTNRFVQSNIPSIFDHVYNQNNQ